MGRSAGRSAGNRTGDGAKRRNTQRERDYIDPPFEIQPEQPESPWRLTKRGEEFFAMAALAAWVFLSVLMAVVICSWVGLL